MSLRTGTGAVMLAGVLALGVLVQAAVAQEATAAGAGAQSQQDSQIQTEVMKTLDNKRFRDVKTTVQNGTVKLTGTVSTYADKEDADKKVHHRKNVHGVENLIEVAAGEVDDQTLRNKLSEKLAYDRVGYGTTTFNALTIEVQNGVVTLGGVAYGPTDKASALSLVSNYKGVRDVIDNIEVAPTSPMDDRIRIDEAQAIYGFPSLNRYAIDPAKPIRITVVNGNVTLTGVVDSQADKDTANIRANGVSGVFKVTNLLQVAGKREERR